MVIVSPELTARSKAFATARIVIVVEAEDVAPHRAAVVEEVHAQPGLLADEIVERLADRVAAHREASLAVHHLCEDRR
jgi:hypothetical protein